MMMKTVVVAALVLLLSLSITARKSSTGKKKRCFRAYDKEKNACSKPFKGRYTFDDCCSKNGASALGYGKRKQRKCTPCSDKDAAKAANWSKWGPWSNCNVQCGKGTVRRRRKCLNTNGLGCPAGRKGTLDKKSCTHPKHPHCPVHGRWSDWGDWKTCSKTCGNGTQLRFRSCTNPKPQHGGKKCVGAREDKKNCEGLPHCPINGNWGSWESWSSCSVTCSVGVRKRTRKCDNPKPQYNGRNCSAHDGVDTQSCDAFKKCRSGSEGSGSGSGSASSSGDDSDYELEGGSAKEDTSGSGSGNDMVGLNIMADQSNSSKAGDFFLEDDKNKPDKKRKT